jgi:SAM-dependent methyltransferase
MKHADDMARTWSVEDCLSGQALYGDDFTAQEIESWYADEAEGYADLGSREAASYRYGYHGWNRVHVYDRLAGRSFRNVLGFGSAYGDELLPLMDQVDAITIVDPSSAFNHDAIRGKPVRYIKPHPSGRLDIPAGTFDLITCFGVLHHIPNVSFVIQEFARVLAPGGVLAIREPIVSMGDWRKPRRGLTRRERGIPLQILDSIVSSTGLKTTARSLCGFPPVAKLGLLGIRHPYNSRLLARIDAICCRIVAWNIHYHPSNRLQQLGPTSAFVVLEKRA